MKRRFFSSWPPCDRLLFTFLLMMLSSPVLAKQLKFERIESDGNITFDYVWHDSKQTEQSWSFTLSANAISSVMNKLTVYQPSIANRLGYIAASKAVNNYDPRKVRVRIRQYPDKIEISTSSEQPEFAIQVRNELLQQVNKARKDYLASNYYVLYTGPFGEQGVIPDHQRVTRESIELLNPLAMSMQARFPNIAARIVADWLLPFIQSIPYETQSARLDSAGIGYLTPTQVLNQNRGDCDSKVTLMAAMMKALYPTLDMVIVYLPDHALLGIQVPSSKSDKMLKINGTAYVLAEVAGPTLFPLGKVADRTNAMLGGAFGHSEL